ncbi:MAG: hypothetical protein ACOWW1_01720 [archaeon]
MSLFDSTAEKLRKHTVKSFVDLIIFTGLKGSMRGYDVLSYIHSTFHVLSSGTIYSYLYSLEREGLTVGEYQNKKHIYKIAEQGINLIIILAQNNIELLARLQSVLNE